MSDEHKENVVDAEATEAPVRKGPRVWQPPAPGEEIHINVAAVSRNIREAAGILSPIRGAMMSDEAGMAMILGGKSGYKS